MMPGIVIFGKWNASAFGCIGNNTTRLAGRIWGGEDIIKLSHVVAIDLNCVPAKAGPFSGHVTGIHDLFGGPAKLETILVDDCHQIFQFVMGCSHGGFPNRTFVAFAVAHEDDGIQLEIYGLQFV